MASQLMSSDSPLPLDGDTALIGASYAGNGWSGKAYVFKRTGTTWTQEAELTASDGQPEDQFGWSVAISGDTDSHRISLR